MLMIILNPKANAALTEEQQAEVGAAHGRLIEATQTAGEFVTMQPLAEPAQTTVVRVRDGETVASDGPLVEAEEFFGGYYVFDVASKDRAIELAALIPDAQWSAVEVRPFLELPE
ncbi:YciI family protein [Catenulispora yoronensis]